MLLLMILGLASAKASRLVMFTIIMLVMVMVMIVMILSLWWCWWQWLSMAIADASTENHEVSVRHKRWGLPIIQPMKSPENRTGKWKLLVWHQFLNHISNPKQRFHIVEQISFHFNFRSPQIGRSLETKQNKSHFTLSLSPTWGNLPHIRDRNRKYTTINTVLKGRDWLRNTCIYA